MNELQQFIDYILHEKRYSRNTAESYKKDIELLMQYFNALNLTLVDLQKDDLKEYLAEIFTHIEASSLHRKIASIRHFYTFLHKREIIDENPAISLTSPKKAQNLPDFLTKNEIELLIKFPFKRDEKGLRDKAIIELLYSSGIRVSELVSICIGDFDFNSRMIKVLGKGKKERHIPVTEASKNAVETYLFHRTHNKNKKSPLFTNLKGVLITTRGIQYILDQLARQAGIFKKVTPHMLRHSFASHFLENGMNLRYLQHMLGHQNLSTTEIYTHLSINELKNVYKKAHPGNKSK